MARLPNPGSDDGTWGQILNDYLSQVHDSDGTLKLNSVATAALQDGSVTRPKIGTSNVAGAGQLLAYDGTNLAWVTGSGGTPDASTSTKGVVKLAGDLGGTADLPTVPGLAGKASLGSATPAALGTAAAGTAVAGSHEDHIHPTTGLTLATGGGVEGLHNINSASGATTLDLAQGNVFNVTLTGDVTFSFTGATNNRACSFGLYISQDATGNRNIIWPGGILWPGGAIPTPTLTANSIDIYVFETITGGSNWFGAQVGVDYS